jgi:hypothetical protein
MKQLLFLLSALFYIGCGGGGNSSTTPSNILDSHPLNLEIKLSSVTQNDNNISGYISFYEKNPFYTKAQFSDLNFYNTDTCKIKNKSITKVNNNTFYFNLNAQETCQSPKISIKETAYYIDTSLKSVTKTIQTSIKINNNYSANLIAKYDSVETVSQNTQSQNNKENNSTAIVKLNVYSVVPQNVTIKPAQSYTFEIYAFDDNNNPVSIPVKITPPVDNNGNVVGSFDKYSVTTDAQTGKATVTYTAPDNITQDTNISVDVIFNNDDNYKKTITINITDKNNVHVQTAAISPETATLNPNETVTFTLYAFDDDNNPVSVPVKITPPIVNGKIMGEFDKYSVTTDTNGKATITYKAPASVDNDTNITVTASFNDEINKTISINLKSGKVSLGTYEIVPNTATIKPAQSYTFEIYAFDDNNNPVSIPVKITPPVDNNGNVVGSFDKYSVTTDAQTGKATVTYTAPTFINEENKTITVPILFNNDQNYEKNLTITIQKITDTAIQPTKLLIIPSKITINPSETTTIKIYTLDNNNRGVSATVLVPHPIDENGNVWGDFSDYTVQTNEYGEGSVKFTSTNDITNLENNLTVAFEVKDTNLKQDLILLKPNTNKQVHYKINFTAPKSIEIEHSAEINIQILDDKDNLVDENNITEINITSTNHLIYFDNNKSKFSKTVNKLNNFNVVITAGTISGIDILDVNASVDGKNVSTQIPLTIISGPVHAISLYPIEEEYSDGLLKRTYLIHAVDKYSNPANPGTKVIVGVIVNKEIKSSNGKIEYFTEETTKFEDQTQSFSDDLLNHMLIVLPDSTHTNPQYLGGWIINNIIDSNTLELSSKYFGDTTDNLNYIIGTEKRYDECDDTIAVADFDHSDKTYEIGTNGTTTVILKYDKALAGKTFTLYANTFDKERIGTSIIDAAINGPSGSWSGEGETNDVKDGLLQVSEYGGSVLIKDIKVSLKIDTTDVCKFADGNIEYNATTDCIGNAKFSVKYDTNGTCSVSVQAIIKEYKGE